jgi:hypothetical protein
MSQDWAEISNNQEHHLSAHLSIYLEHGQRVGFPDSSAQAPTDEAELPASLK